MPYAVKEIFFTLQGEGAQSGRAAVFCRFAGCNLWSGLERNRPTAICRFCDTQFVGTDGPGGGRFADATQLAAAVASHWPAESEGRARPYVVCTGGEPLLQLDAPLVDALHLAGFEIAIETNGTLDPPDGIDWICVSPKSRAAVVIRSGDELKFVYPQADVDPSEFADYEFEHFFIQPLDDQQSIENTKKATQYCLSHPQWRLTLQAHKYLGIP